MERIVVTGASGNVGTGVLRELVARHPDAEIIGVCRRPPPPEPPYDGVAWHPIDLGATSAPALLKEAFQGATAVIHLGWQIQPVRDEPGLRRANVEGTRHVLHATYAAGVRHLVYASSLGAYAPGIGAPVDETWPDSGRSTSQYSRHKVIIERMLDQFEREHPSVTVARLRPTLVVQRTAATEIKNLFIGPLVPAKAFDLLRRGALPVLPLPAGIALQFVHSDDVGDAVVRILEKGAAGAFNLAADVLDSHALAGLLGARAVPVPPEAFRAAVVALFRLHAVPVSPGWFDVAADSPLMDTTRARTELGWAPRRSSAEGARELIDGLAERAVGASAALGG